MPAKEEIISILETITDPEIPVLSVMDMGIVRDVQMHDNMVTIAITPTYTGCPAMDMISMQIRMGLLQHGISQVTIQQVLSPAWTTDWMTPQGKAKLQAYGIAPPVGSSHQTEVLEELQPACPQCGSHNTRLLSAFGSTACKALFQCNDCKEPFDYFKCH
jgi:ring-1,2-phenylacetyl-CoA epoxidase subunit PaaD